MNSKLETAVFGGGCFWCTEAIFNRLKGVENVISGYAGGHIANPTDNDIYYKDSGHAEVVKIEFDPNKIKYSQLIEVFFATHDPTTLNRQGIDVGTQYRSVIFTTSDHQLQLAEEKIDELSESGKFNDLIVTEVKPLNKFYTAADYHQNFYQSGQRPDYCRLVIDPKLKKLEEKFAHLLKD